MTFNGSPIFFLTFHRPLPNRRNIVLTSNIDATRKELNIPPEVILAPSLENALNAISPDSPIGKEIESVYVIGGETVYHKCLDSKYCRRVLRTCILSDMFQDCDTFFPKLPEDQWKRVSCSEIMEDKGLKFVFEEFKKIENTENGNQNGGVSRNCPTPAVW